MRPQRSVFAIAVLPWLFTACIGTPPPKPLVEHAQSVSSDYTGSVATTSWLIEEAPGGDATHGAATSSGEPTASYRLTVFSLDTDHVIPPKFDFKPGAQVVSATAAHSGLADAEPTGHMRKVTQQDFGLDRNGRAKVTLVSQTAYVSGCEIQTTTAGLLFDPEIKVAEDGMIVDLRTAGNTVEVVWTTATLLRPVAESRVKVAQAELAMQLPIYANHRLRTTTTLDDGDALLLTGVPGDRKERFFALLSRGSLAPRHGE